MRLGKALMALTILLGLLGIAGIVATLITFNGLWAALGAISAFAGGLLGFWNSARFARISKERNQT